MRVKDFEEKIMDLKIEGLQILSMRMRHNHVTRCLAVKEKSVFIWYGDGQCYTKNLIRGMYYDEIIEMYNYASTTNWERKTEYDIK